jgi:SAM-dependent methyltransferase
MRSAQLALAAISFAGLALPQASEYDSIYRGEAGDVFSRQPNAFLAEMVRSRKPGSALDVGMGQGRNSIYLAQQGWQVTGIDTSEEGIRQAKLEAARLGLTIRAEVADFEEFDFGENRWDLIVLVYEPTKAVAPKVVRALKAGGAVVVEDRHVDTRRVWPAGTFTDNELLSQFPGLRTLHYEDVWALPDWSAKKINERLVRLMAEKAAPPPSGCIWENRLVHEGDTACWDTAVLSCGATGWVFTREKCVR